MLITKLWSFESHVRVTATPFEIKKMWPRGAIDGQLSRDWPRGPIAFLLNPRGLEVP